MNTARYVLALICIMTYPAAVGWWYVTHPFIDFWRRLGAPASITILAIASLLLAAAGYLLRGPLLAVEFGTNPYLWPPAALIYAASIYVELRARKHLKIRILAGVPELQRDGRGGRLITEGIYGTVRHPRYLGVWLGTAAVAFFTNYLAVYVIALLMIPALYLVVMLEENELRDRFGDEYLRYCERVPRRFIPRWSAGRPAGRASG
jgi:protein-S-isoprenylcysteine O-methyltransferase Ste14